MAGELWAAVESYFNDLLVPEDLALEEALRSSEAAGLPPHQVTPSEGKLLHLLARIQGARRVLEIGTLGGYSTIWFSNSPSFSTVVSFEINRLRTGGSISVSTLSSSSRASPPFLAFISFLTSA